jgi:hypothetical protein
MSIVIPQSSHRIRSCREIAKESLARQIHPSDSSGKGLLTEEQLGKILDLYSMTEPGKMIRAP